MKFTITNYYKNMTIRDFLQFYHVSKTLIYKLQLNENISVNGEFKKFNYQLQENDELEFDINVIENNTTPIYKGEIDVLYEDEDILIVSKPSAMLVHSDGNTNNTLANRVSYYYKKNNMPNAVRYIHRLDYETTGMVIFAKHFLAHSYLNNLLEQRKVKKLYICLCENVFFKNKGVINKPIGKDRHQNKQIISTTGKDAITKYRVLETKDNISKVEVQIIGGRKHQIRVHMSSIGHPIVGDSLYGSKIRNRVMLHFYRIEFIHPRTLQTFEYTSDQGF